MKTINKEKMNKGFSLPELLITLLIFGMASVLITQILIFNIRSTKSYSEYTKQQFTLQDAYHRLNKDINAATKISYKLSDITTIKLTIDNEDVTWKLEDGKLILNGTTITDQLTADSGFSFATNYLVVTLEAKPSDNKIDAVNIAKPIISQYNIFRKIVHQVV